MRCRQRAIVPDIGEGSDARAGAAFQFGLGLDQRLAKLDERAGAEQRAEKESVGAKRAPDLHQRAGEIVDAVKREARDDEVEACLLERQQVLVADERRARAQRGERVGALGIDHLPDRFERGNLLAQQPVKSAEVEREREGAEHDFDPLGDLARDMGEQELMRLDLGSEARAAGAEQLAVEQEMLFAHGGPAPPLFQLGRLPLIMAVHVDE